MLIDIKHDLTSTFYLETKLWEFEGTRTKLHTDFIPLELVGSSASSERKAKHWSGVVKRTCPTTKTFDTLLE